MRSFSFMLISITFFAKNLFVAINDSKVIHMAVLIQNNHIQHKYFFDDMSHQFSDIYVSLCFSHFQSLIHTSRPVSLQIEGHIREAKTSELLRDPCPQLRRQKPFHLFRQQLDAG